MIPQLDNGKHVKFLKRHLELLPSSHQEHDPNKMAIIFYAVMGLAALNIDVSKEYKANLHWLHKHYRTIRSPDSQETISGFTGTSSMLIPSVNCLSLPNTLFAILICRTLKDDEFFDGIIHSKSVASFVGRCQDPEVGSFISTLDYKRLIPSPVDAGDLRFCYIAVAILQLVGFTNESELKEFIDVEKLIEYILAQQCADGGFGSYGEPHAGYTSCALSALSLLGKLDRLSYCFKERTISWLVSRQVSNEGCMRFQEGNDCFDSEDHGGFQGRENKFADTCYVFWCLNSLRLLTPDGCELPIQPDLAEDFLINRTQNHLIGGFSKNDQDDPDLYHTCLGIAALAMLDGSFDGVLFIPKGITV